MVAGNNPLTGLRVVAGAQLNWCTPKRFFLQWPSALGKAVDAMQITLEIRPEILHRFMAAHADLTTWLGYVPPLEWFMSFALESSDPAALKKSLEEIGRDYLRNRRSLD